MEKNEDENEDEDEDEVGDPKETARYSQLVPHPRCKPEDHYSPTTPHSTLNVLVRRAGGCIRKIAEPSGNWDRFLEGSRPSGSWVGVAAGGG